MGACSEGDGHRECPPQLRQNQSAPGWAGQSGRNREYWPFPGGQGDWHLQGCPGRPAGSSVRWAPRQGWEGGKRTPCTGLGTGTASPGEVWVPRQGVSAQVGAQTRFKCPDKVWVPKSGSPGAQDAWEGSQERLPGTAGTGALGALRDPCCHLKAKRSFPLKQPRNRQVLSEVKSDLTSPSVPSLFPSFKRDLEVCLPSPAVPGVGGNGRRQLLSSPGVNGVGQALQCAQGLRPYPRNFEYFSMSLLLSLPLSSEDSTSHTHLYIRTKTPCQTAQFAFGCFCEVLQNPAVPLKCSGKCLQSAQRWI